MTMKGRKFRWRHAAVAALSAFLLYLPSAASATTTAHVNVQDFSFSPGTQNIGVGDSIEWDWVSGTHTTTSDDGGVSWNSPINMTTTSFTHMFNSPGAFSYHCTFHPTQMQGTIVVGDVFRFTASTASVFEGDTVHVTLQRLGAGTGIAQVAYGTHNGSATVPFDYVGIAGTASWADGDTTPKTIDVLTKDDGGTDTADKDFTIDLSNPSAGGALGTPASVTVTIREPIYKPDTLVKGPADATYKGNGIYNTLVGQTSLARVPKGKSATFRVKVQNDGNVPDTFAIKGKGSTTAFSIHYFRGMTNITKAVVAGTEMTSSLDPGKSWTIKAVIAPKAAASIGATIRDVVSAKSSTDLTKTDAVGLKEKVIAS
jgi:plastocyanin